MHKKADLGTDILILRATGPLPGFKVLKLDQLLPELFELGEHREEANHRSLPGAPKYSTACYVVEGTNRIVFDNAPGLALKAGSVAFGAACRSPCSIPRRRGAPCARRFVNVSSP